MSLQDTAGLRSSKRCEESMASKEVAEEYLQVKSTTDVKRPNVLVIAEHSFYAL